MYDRNLWEKVKKIDQFSRVPEAKKNGFHGVSRVSAIKFDALRSVFEELYEEKFYGSEIMGPAFGPGRYDKNNKQGRSQDFLWSGAQFLKFCTKL